MELVIWLTLNMVSRLSWLIMFTQLFPCGSLAEPSVGGLHGGHSLHGGHGLHGGQGGGYGPGGYGSALADQLNRGGGLGRFGSWPVADDKHKMNG